MHRAPLPIHRAPRHIFLLAALFPPAVEGSFHFPCQSHPRHDPPPLLSCSSVRYKVRTILLPAISLSPPSPQHVRTRARRARGRLLSRAMRVSRDLLSPPPHPPPIHLHLLVSSNSTHFFMHTRRVTRPSRAPRRSPGKPIIVPLT
ncbi:hypothetical protein K523DRAFT_27343 [Schizophyllum commune Tattone D]|nr:hypothetical protein K523DRAFT_27343 [Schizophyllum commune Tattone D]